MARMSMAMPPRHISIDGLSDKALRAIPAKRPVKPIYVRKFMDYVKAADDGEFTED